VSIASGMRWLPVAACAVGMAAAAATIAVGLRIPDRPPARAVAGPPFRVLATLADREVFFGDEVEARLEIVLDTRKLSEERLRVRTRFEPYRVAQRAVLRERLGDGFRRVVFRYRLRCLGTSCMPQAGSERVFTFRPALVDLGARPTRAGWPSLVVASRIHGAPEIRMDDLRSLSALNGSPDRRAARLLISSGALGLAAAAFVAWRIAARRRPVGVAPMTPVHSPAFDPVEAACARVRDRLASALWERERGALDNLAREVAQAGDSRRAAEVRELAWRRERPSESEVERVLSAVEASARRSDAA
jgi:hypothetical protein